MLGNHKPLVIKIIKQCEALFLELCGADSRYGFHDLNVTVMYDQSHIMDIFFELSRVVRPCP